MKTTDLYSDRVPTINTQGLDLNTYGFCELRVDAGCTLEDPDHSRGFVRLELDRDLGGGGGGIATKVVRPGSYRNGEPKDVLEIHAAGDAETAALARALIFAGKEILKGLGDACCESEQDKPTNGGVLHILPNGSVYRGTK
ncbi:MAG: hypothetical protein ACLPH3_09670 [Terracidiphilus sp.]